MGVAYAARPTGLSENPFFEVPRNGHARLLGQRARARARSLRQLIPGTRAIFYCLVCESRWPPRGFLLVLDGVMRVRWLRSSLFVSA